MRHCRKGYAARATLMLALSYPGTLTLAGDDSVSTSALKAQSDEYLSRLERLGFSGGVIIEREGETILMRGCGMADQERGTPFTEKTVFPIGSVTKPITATAVMTLVDDGKLKTDDPITKFFENVPPDKTGITVHHLLTHSSGLESALGGDFDRSATRDWLFREAMNSELLWPPGTRYEYSNVGYALLAMIIEKLSGQSFEQYMKERVFDRAGMTRTGYALPQFNPDELAVCYQSGKPWGTMYDQPMLDDGPCWNLRGNGGLHTTLKDMRAFHDALSHGRIISTDAQNRSLKPHINEGYGDSWYGYGWTLFKTPRGTNLWTHNGGDGGGYSAEIRRYVDEGLFIFVASSSAEFIADHIGNDLARFAFGVDVDMPPKVISLDKTSLTAWEGIYKLADGGSITVKAMNRGLSLSPSNQNALQALTSGAPLAPSVAKDLNARTLDCVEAASRGDFKPLTKAFGGGLELEEIADMEGGVWRAWNQELGAFTGATVIGTAPYRRGMLSTTVRLEFAQGVQFLRYAWEGGQLRGIRPLPGGVEVSVFPTSPTEFVAFQLGQPSHARVTFSGSSHDGPLELMLQGPGAPVRATYER